MSEQVQAERNEPPYSTTSLWFFCSGEQRLREKKQNKHDIVTYLARQILFNILHRCWQFIIAYLELAPCHI